MPPSLGFVGAGQMAAALARGWVAAGALDPANCLASAPSAASRAAFTDATGISTTADNQEVLAATGVIVLAVKPQVMGEVCAALGAAVKLSHLFVSIAGGISLAQLGRWLGDGARVVRVMPNTPYQVSAGTAGYAPNDAATEADAKLVGELFSTGGKSVRVKESLLDAVSAVSGSGPAYVYLLMEALADGGVFAGLTRKVALELAAQTALGAGKMVLETATHPAILKDAVASPGGSTIAAIRALEAGGFRAAVMSAVAAAHARSAELGR